MRNRAWYISWIGAAIVFIAACTVAISVGPDTNLPQQMTGWFDVRSTVATLRGGKVEAALRPIPPIHDALWPPLPVYL